MKAVEAVVRRFSIKKVFLKISQNSQENTYARVPFLIKLNNIGYFLKTLTMGKDFPVALYIVAFLRCTKHFRKFYMSLFQESTKNI